jgi:hypothetical protein
MAGDSFQLVKRKNRHCQHRGSYKVHEAVEAAKALDRATFSAFSWLLPLCTTMPRPGPAIRMQRRWG